MNTLDDIYVADNGQIIDISNSANSGNLSLHSCSMNGICINEEGYIKDKDSKYYTASSDGSSSLVNPASLINSSSCNRSNIGKLTTEYKLCIGDETVDFTAYGEDPKYYIINEDDGKRGVIYVDSNIITKRKFSSGKLKNFFNKHYLYYYNIKINIFFLNKSTINILINMFL